VAAPFLDTLSTKEKKRIQEKERKVAIFDTEAQVLCCWVLQGVSVCCSVQVLCFWVLQGVAW